MSRNNQRCSGPSAEYLGHGGMDLAALTDTRPVDFHFPEDGHDYFLDLRAVEFR